MKIIFDINTPAPLGRYLKGHEVTLASDLGWQELENGDLLDVAEANGYEVLISCDKNLRNQQNFVDRKLCVVILWTNHWPTLKAVAMRIANHIDFVQRGQVLRLDSTTL